METRETRVPLTFKIATSIATLAVLDKLAFMTTPLLPWQLVAIEFVGAIIILKVRHKIIQMISSRQSTTEEKEQS